MTKKNKVIEQQLGIPPDYQYHAINSANFIHANWHKNKIDTLTQLLKLKKSSKILDLGIGSGNFELVFSSKVKEIVGLDYNSEAINYAKSMIRKNNINNVKLKLADVKNLSNMKLGKFDFIIMVDVIEHFSLPEAKRIIQSFKKFLNTSGRVCLVTPNFKSGWILLEWLLDKFHLAPELSGKQHISKFDPETLKSAFKDTGYKIERVATFNTFSYLIPNQKIRVTLNKWEVNNFKYGNMIAIIARL